MKNLFKALSLLIILAMFSSQVQAQCILNNEGVLVQADGTPCVNTIVTAVPFLRIVPEARSGAMGDAGLALSPDANAMHLNASKLAFVEKDLGISVTYTPWLRALGLQDIYLAYLSGFKRINDDQTLGFSLRYFSLGNIQFRDENGEPIGNGRPNEFEIGLGYSRKLSPYFAAGLSGKFVYSSLASGQTVGGQEIQPGLTGAADLSFTYRRPDLFDKKGTLSWALAISNIGPKISYTNSVNKDFIPTNLGIGGGFEYDIDEFNSIAIVADINKLLVPTPAVPALDENSNDVPDYKEVGLIDGILTSFGDAPGGTTEEFRELMYSVGLEYWYDKQFAVRAGYYSEHATKGNRKYATVGLGIKYNIFGLNFSYLVPLNSNRNPLDNTLRFSLLFDFADFSDDEPE